MDLLWMARDLGTLLTFLVSDLIGATGAITATLLLAVRFDGIGRWSAAQMVFMLGYALLACGMPNILFNYNVSFISRRIGRGQLDHMLLQPQPLWMGLLTDGFSPFSTLMELLPGTALLAWSIGHGAMPALPFWPLALALNLAASTAIALSFSFIWGSLAFWAPRAAEELNSASWNLVSGLAPFPLDGVGRGLATGLLTAIPAGFLAWYPARALLGLDTHAYAWLLTPLAAAAFAALAILVFQKGLGHYARTGSARYLSLGHRR
jgi:ABC-2 type transport system permease protein